ncbi:MAG TPA: hypothetical protein V6C65_04565 [Allocoleopsis sp.]
MLLFSFKRKLYRWWRQGKDVRLERYSEEEGSTVLIEFPAIGTQIMLRKEPGQSADEAIRDYLQEFQIWRDREEASGDRPTTFRVLEELISELHYQFLQVRQLLR